MRAADIMTPNVITVSPQAAVPDIARLLLEHRISAVPVVDDQQRVLGIVSEGDLMGRADGVGKKRSSWRLASLLSSSDSAQDYIKTHGRTAEEVMTHPVIEVAEETPLHEIARLLEKRHIKRVPVTREGRLVGIVSRANLLQGLSTATPEAPAGVSADDRTLREQIIDEIRTGLNAVRVNVIVTDGNVELWGLVDSDEEKKAAQLAAESVPGVKHVSNNLGRLPPSFGAY